MAKMPGAWPLDLMHSGALQQAAQTLDPPENFYIVVYASRQQIFTMP